MPHTAILKPYNKRIPLERTEAIRLPARILFIINRRARESDALRMNVSLSLQSRKRIIFNEKRAE